VADPRWLPLAAYRDAAVADLALALALWDDAARFAELPRAREKAFQKALQDAYSSFEQAALYVLKLAGEPRPSGDRWHADLLVMVTQPTAQRPALAADLVGPLRQLMRFRHVALHAYADFEMEKADHSAAAARRLLADLPAAFDAFGRSFGLLPAQPE
jgi:hypothetical protein